MYRELIALGEKYIYHPNFILKLVAILLLPISFIYTLILILKFKLTKQRDFSLPIISVGNLTLGGSGKTPLGIAILNEFEGGFVILRGYKRASNGLVVVANQGKILANIKESGDEAMEYAKSVKNANVIVCENRDLAIQKAKELSAKFILLDDGFSKFHIKKLNILINPKFKPYFNFTLPSGGYRYPVSFYKFADIVISQEAEFYRSGIIEHATEKMVLVAAIANPTRLNEYHKEYIASEFFPDHYNFCKAELVKIFEKYHATSLLVTMKDFVKICDFGLPLSVIRLKTTLNEDFKLKLRDYIKR